MPSLIDAPAQRFILWEVDRWIPEPPRDPFLLKHIGAGLYAILAAWELTEIERAVMRQQGIG